jgi:hypothetical protein
MGEFVMRTMILSVLQAKRAEYWAMFLDTGLPPQKSTWYSINYEGTSISYVYILGNEYPQKKCTEKWVFVRYAHAHTHTHTHMYISYKKSKYDSIYHTSVHR